MFTSYDTELYVKQNKSLNRARRYPHVFAYALHTAIAKWLRTLNYAIISPGARYINLFYVLLMTNELK